MPSGIRLTSAAYMQPSGIRSITRAYMPPADIRHTPASHTYLSTGPAYPAVHHLSSASHLPIAMITTSVGHSIELSNLAKIYTNNAKYCGCIDSFIFKLVIFHNICLKTDILPKAKMKAFFTILKDLALDYYYSNIIISAVIMNFDHVSNSFRNYFKEAEYKQSVYLKWNGLKLKSIISKNEGKPIEEYLKKFIDQL